MRGIPVSKEEILKIKRLRRTGHSLPEIRALLNRGSSTVFKYIQGVEVLPQYALFLKEKQGGSKARSQKLWEKSREKVREISFSSHKKDLLLLIAGLYWAEGNKKDLNLINSDPDLVRIFIQGLLKLGVEKDDLRISLRLYEDIDELAARKFWAEKLDIGIKKIISIDRLGGKKNGKLPYGMCRVRVAKGGDYFKIIMSSIEQIKTLW
ncbi:MAG: hypothetical protein A2808_03465 [Candidatus Moranbacteria bacterium RIFCSPHIGHO2_01_FULL_55_24]|nr:MAG: hypothetical protein A2808_03465 [Candidatus Moranbacteria bacterium RIFCSPHIGHO2_01_FULL_55_24]